jgi:hypothetical protein
VYLPGKCDVPGLVTSTEKKNSDSDNLTTKGMKFIFVFGKRKMYMALRGIKATPPSYRGRKLKKSRNLLLDP